MNSGRAAHDLVVTTRRRSIRAIAAARRIIDEPVSI
jgi:hypothetical protein